ncbi:MAG: hypothetical protein PHQ12_00310 [Chthoniobacteraceae bacterium]|nr:hypothetical protein [Chthoniobacteraceae bacterium]
MKSGENKQESGSNAQKTVKNFKTPLQPGSICDTKTIPRQLGRLESRGWKFFEKSDIRSGFRPRSERRGEAKNAVGAEN